MSSYARPLGLGRPAPASAWWASSRRNARATTFGAILLVLALLGAGALVWTSPATSPITRVNELMGAAQAAAGPTTEDRLRERIVELYGELRESRDALVAAGADTSELEAQLAVLQQQVWSLEGTLEAERVAGSSGGSAPGGSGGAGGSGGGGPADGSGDGSGDGDPPPAAPPAEQPISAPSRAEIIAPDSPYFGMYTEQAPFNWATLDATAVKIDATPDMVGYFSGWDEDFRVSAVERSWQRGKLPMMTWESRPISAGNDEVEAPEYSLPRILAGEFDDYLTRYARDIVATGLPLAIRFDHEMNGVWYPWSETTGSGAPINGNGKGDFAKVWRYVHELFEREGANELVAWVWAPNRIDNLPKANQSPEFLAALYPGDEYVDWVGLSGYLRPPVNGEVGFEQTFGRTLEQLRALTDKPILLAEVGATETGGRKAEWIESFFGALAQPANADIVGFSWFSLAITSYVEGVRATNDWRIDSRADSTEAFAAGLRRQGSPFRLNPV